jgi:hypothetical protein
MVVKAIFHTFRMGDVEDPYLYAGFPISEWQKTEHGRWIMEHAVGEPVFWCDPDPVSMGYRVSITGELEEKDYTFFKLKWGNCAENYCR